MSDFVGYSYVTVEEADSYFALQLSTGTWDSSSPDDKQKALYQATTAIDRLAFKGVKSNVYNTALHGVILVDQPLEFPRGGATVVPDGIRAACCECAVAFLDGVDIDQEIRRQRIKSQGFASVRQTYQDDVVADYFMAGIPSYKAWILLLEFLNDPRTIRRVRTS